MNDGGTDERDSDLSWSSMFVSGFDGGYYHGKCMVLEEVVELGERLLGVLSFRRFVRLRIS